MLSRDDGLSEPIVLDEGYEVGIVGSQTFTSFSLILDWVPFELTPTALLVMTCQGPSVPFILWPEDDDLEERDIQIVTRSGRVAQPSSLVARPFDGAASHEEVKREDDELLMQWCLLLCHQTKLVFYFFCFSEETTDCGVVIEPIEMTNEFVPHDEYRDEMNMMSMSQIAEMVQL